MSDDDDSVSIESNPFERTVMTEERLAHFRRIHEENPHPVYWGPPLESPGPASPRSPAHSLMSDDDDVYMESNPFARTAVTEELLAYYQKLRGEPTDGLYLKGCTIWPPSPKEPKRRTRHMLVGLANPFPDHGLKRSPTGRVRSCRLEAQRKRDTASQPPNKRGKVRKRKSSGPKASKAKPASQRRRAS